jgi:Regulator of chromosome condensation (RCC1) repeat/Family of unknown function (DUF6247)
MFRDAGLTDRINRIRAGLRARDLASFDAELHEALLYSGQSGDLSQLDHVIEAWSRVVLTYEVAGTALTALEESLRRGEEPEWTKEPPYRLLQTPAFSTLITGLSDADQVSLAELTSRLASDPLPGGRSGFEIERFGSLPNTYSVPFGAGLLVYLVPPHQQIIGLVLVYQPLAVWSWGSNGSGALGDGTLGNRSTPVQAVGVTSGRSIAVGEYHNLYVDDLTLRVWVWGMNAFGQLGDGTTTDRILPVQLTGLSSVAYVNARGFRSMALRSDGTVWNWGQLVPAPNSMVPTQVAGLSGVERIAAGWFHSLALRSDGTVWAWGANYSGQLGDGTTTVRLNPVQVSGLADVIAIAAGIDQGMALKADGTVWTWETISTVSSVTALQQIGRFPCRFRFQAQRPRSPSQITAWWPWPMEAHGRGAATSKGSWATA